MSRANQLSKNIRWFAHFLLTCGFVGLLAIVSAIPAQAAERISFFVYPWGQFNIQVEDLELFATEGRISKRFAIFANRLTAKEQTRLKNILKDSISLDLVMTHRLAHSAMGNNLLRQLSLINREPTEVSFYLWRAALIEAAKPPEGLNLLKILRAYSAKTIWLDLNRIKVAMEKTARLLRQQEKAIAAVERQAQLATASIDAPQLSNLALPGYYQWRRETFTFTRPNSQVLIPVVLYLPQNLPTKAPTVVIAPGLGSELKNFKYLAEHLASHGFAAAILNFPASDTERISQYLSGLNTQPLPQEWVEQPKDVTYLLDELAKNPNWRSQLNLKQVGVVGHSLGGYTGLALGGAKVDWQKFQRACTKTENQEQLVLNLSFLWQCSAVETASPSVHLRDKRVVAVLAVNPLTNPIFAQKGISQIPVPTMLIASSEDVFAPPLAEQILPFTWIENPNKYLVTVKGATHFSFIGGDGKNDFPLPAQILGTNQAIAYSYLQALSVAFMQRHLAHQPEFAAYLTASSVNNMSEPELPISLIGKLTQKQLKKAIQ